MTDKTKFTFRQYASSGTSFAPGCFDSQVGTMIPFRTADRTYDGKILQAEISEDGSYVELSLEVPREALPSMSLALGLSIEEAEDQ